MLLCARVSESQRRFSHLFSGAVSGLATDGFNPFGNLSTSYSIWPVVLIPYNLPPWMCMKSSAFLLSMIIPGKRASGNDIDVYLQPLIQELKELWINGVDTYDSFKGEMFTMHAAVMWTISDFPGLGTLSGWNTHTGQACPSCNFDSTPCRLPQSRKWCFMGHRRFLSRGHKFRLAHALFDGTVEMRNPPNTVSGDIVLSQVEHLNVIFGKEVEGDGLGRRPRAANSETQQWRKRSIFFELPYWHTNLIRHNLDVMHIEKNVCDNVLFTILNETGKSKDHVRARRDLQDMGIRPELWPDDNGRYRPAVFTLTRTNKEVFLKTLKEITVPDGYSSNISRCIDLRQMKIGGLKSHDAHILIEQLLPLALRKSVPKPVAAVLIELCSFFRHLCNKVLHVDELDKLKDRIIHILCHLEMLFPPSFFTVMVHLTVHLVDEAKCGGPVHYRWMYPIERYLGKLKSYVRNRAQPEGSIAEGYLAEEILTFCARYLDGVETVFNRPRRVDDEPELPSNSGAFIPQLGRPVGGSQYITLSPLEILQAHRHVLTNCRHVDPYIQEFRDIVKRQLRGRTRSSTEIDKRVHREFPEWFSKRIRRDGNEDSYPIDLQFLAQGPLETAKQFTAYNVNGLKFRTVGRDEGLRTQNSGVFGTFGTRSYASGSDGNMQFGGVPYYGKVVDMIELNYRGRFTVALFKCLWADTTTRRGIVVDEFGITNVNFDRLIHKGDHVDDEPYIQPSEAQMVYYVTDELDKSWSAAIHIKPRDLFDMGHNDEQIVHEIESYRPQDLDVLIAKGESSVPLVREDDDDDHMQMPA